MIKANFLLSLCFPLLKWKFESKLAIDERSLYRFQIFLWAATIGRRPRLSAASWSLQVAVEAEAVVLCGRESLNSDRCRQEQAWLGLTRMVEQSGSNCSVTTLDGKLELDKERSALTAFAFFKLGSSTLTRSFESLLEG